MKLTQQQLENHLWGAANILRGKTARQDYKNYILSLMFYKRLCDQWDNEIEEKITAYKQMAGYQLTEPQKAGMRATDDYRFTIPLPPGSGSGEDKAVANNVGERGTDAMRKSTSANEELRASLRWTGTSPLRNRLNLPIPLPSVRHKSRVQAEGCTMKLGAGQFERLHRALLSAFPNIPALNKLVRVGLDRNLATIADGRDVSDTILKLIEWADAQNLIVELVGQARRENQRNLELKDFAEELVSLSKSSQLQPLPSAGPVPPAESHTTTGRMSDIPIDRPVVRLYLYSKSRVQRQIAETEAKEIPHSHFRKPDIQNVFDSLYGFGQPDATIVSLDEWWIRLLAQRGVLEDLSGFERDTFWGELTDSAKYDGKYWSLPHFFDFSFYTCLREHRDKLKEWLHNVVTANEPESKVNELQESMRTDRLLVYDFNTPDSAVCTLLEFIQTCGSRVEGLTSPGALCDPVNIKALSLLRAMIGKVDRCRYGHGEPLNFNNGFTHVPFLRDWHSRFSDMSETLRLHTAILDGPMAGTVGGWHVGVLAGSAFKNQALRQLSLLLNENNQTIRFDNNGGLPTRAQFYAAGYDVTYPDDITGVSLKEIREYAPRLIRRSKLEHYREMRAKLIDLHYGLIRIPIGEVQDHIHEWARRSGPQWTT